MKIVNTFWICLSVSWNFFMVWILQIWATVLCHIMVCSKLECPVHYCGDKQKFFCTLLGYRYLLSKNIKSFLWLMWTEVITLWGILWIFNVSKMLLKKKVQLNAGTLNYQWLLTEQSWISWIKCLSDWLQFKVVINYY